MMLCCWAGDGALREIVMTSSSWSLEDEDITTLHEDEVITIVETSGTVHPTTRRLTPEDSNPTRFNIHKFHVPPIQCINSFVWISEQTAIISLYTLTDWFV
jgi:hypothetical protein